MMSRFEHGTSKKPSLETITHEIENIQTMLRTLQEESKKLAKIIQSMAGDNK